MLKRRPIQYLGLALLVLASIAVIYLPIGPTPQEQPYTLHFAAPRAFSALVKKGQTPELVADKALSVPFPSNVPKSGLVIGPDGKTATIQDTATTQEQGRERSGKIVAAITKAFAGVKLSQSLNIALASLPPAPLLPFGPNAIFPPQREANGTIKPAVKLGLDLQGGVNLVLQVRRAIFPYTLNKALPADTTARDKFTADVQAALANAGNNLGDANIVLTPGRDNALEIRTQANDSTEFNNQKKALTVALKSVGGYSLTAGKAQFFRPDAKAQGGAATTVSDSEILSRTVEIVRSRVDKLGVSEPLIQAQGTDRIVVQLPGVNDPQKAVEVVGQTAQMNIYLLPQSITSFRGSSANGQEETRFAETSNNNPLTSEEVIRRSGAPIVTGGDLKPTSTVSYDQSGQFAVSFELTPDAAQRFGQATSKNMGRVMPIFLDQRCITAPNIKGAIFDNGQISGGFKTIDEARNLALLLNSGALPAPVDVVENRTVSATLGQDSLRKAGMAGLIGICAVAVFMIAFYRLAGLLANCALVIYFLLNLAAFVLVGGTLTLPGIAGFLLAVAMSLDTNILVFERLREEMATQPTFAGALRAAFDRAWTAILDSHVTTLIAAVVLFYLGSGPVKGFALTLGIGVLLSLFSAISVTRLFMWSVARIGEKNHSLFVRPVARAATGEATPARG